MYEALLRWLIRHGQDDGIILPEYLKHKLDELHNISDIKDIINTHVEIENDPPFTEFG